VFRQQTGMTPLAIVEAFSGLWRISRRPMEGRLIKPQKGLEIKPSHLRALAVHYLSLSFK
jgi:hypothetical protein